MTGLKSVLLPDRGVIRVTGADAEKLLQGVITGDMELLKEDRSALHAGLLTPQGKILFDFFVVRHGDGFFIETNREQVPDLLKRLSMYKLRAAAVITDVSGAYAVAAVWGDGAEAAADQSDGVAFADPRLAAMGLRVLLASDDSGPGAKLPGEAVGLADYHAMRVALGVPEAGKDYRLGDTFPHEALFDQLGGVSFTKGCFVGQEVVSRMQHRGTARKRVVPVVGTGALPEPGSEVRAGSSLIGTLGSVAGNTALGMLRLDRAAEAAAKGEALMAGGVAVSIKIPEWATFGPGEKTEAGK
jgi:tRNA-modifying protein YgfZ